MRIGLKIIACLLGLALLVAAVGYRAWRTNDTLRDELDVLAGSAVQEVLGPSDMLLALEAVQQACGQLITARAQPLRAGNAAVGRTIDALVDAVDGQIAASRRADGTGVASSSFAGSTAVASDGSLDRIASEVTLHRGLLQQVVRLSASQPAAAARLFQERVQPHYLDVLVPRIQAYQDEAERRLRQDAADAQGRLRRANMGNAVLVALALAIAAVLGALLMRSLVRRDEALRQAAARIGAGELGARMEDGARQELGDLAGPLDEMARRLQATTVSRRSLETVVGAIDEIAVVTDPEGRVAMVNRAAIDRLGWDPATVCGRPVDELLRTTTGPDGVELIAHDGTIRRTTCSQRTLHDPAGRPQGRVWIARDAG